MRQVALTAFAICLAAAAPALAKSHKNATDGFCPPGLAKKNPPCIPPGQAKKYGIGQTIPENEWSEYEEYLLWEKLGLPRPGEGESYYMIGDQLLLLDRKTGQLINVIDALDELLNN